MTHAEKAVYRRRIADYVAETGVLQLVAARKFRVSQGMVSKAMREHGVIIRKKQDTSFQILRWLQETNFTHRQIAGECGVTPQRVQQVAMIARGVGFKLCRSPYRKVQPC